MRIVQLMPIAGGSIGTWLGVTLPIEIEFPVKLKLLPVTTREVNQKRSVLRQNCHPRGLGS
jgi:hypothetical protein